MTSWLTEVGTETRIFHSMMFYYCRNPGGNKLRESGKEGVY